MQEIAFEIDAQRVGRASGYLGGLTIERYTFTGATIPTGTRLAILTRAGVTIAAAEITEGNSATVDTNTQEVADLLRYQPLGACESVYIALGNADTIIALIPAVMRKNWLDDESTHPPVPANRYPTKTELDEWLARFDERAAAAETAKEDAQAAAAQAASRATAAQTAKVAAESAATAAQTAQGKAEAAQAAAETAQNGAEAAKDAAAHSATEAAQSAQEAAENVTALLQGKVEAAEAAKAGAEAAKTAAEAAKAGADAAKAAAASSATAAANSAEAAKQSATDLADAVATAESLDGRIAYIENGKGVYKNQSTGEVSIYKPLMQCPDGSLKVVTNLGVAVKVLPVECADNEKLMCADNGEYVFLFRGTGYWEGSELWVYDKNLSRKFYIKNRIGNGDYGGENQGFDLSSRVDIVGDRLYIILKNTSSIAMFEMASGDAPYAKSVNCNAAVRAIYYNAQSGNICAVIQKTVDGNDRAYVMVYDTDLNPVLSEDGEQLIIDVNEVIYSATNTPISYHMNIGHRIVYGRTYVFQLTTRGGNVIENMALMVANADDTLSIVHESILQEDPDNPGGLLVERDEDGNGVYDDHELNNIYRPITTEGPEIRFYTKLPSDRGYASNAVRCTLRFQQHKRSYGGKNTRFLMIDGVDEYIILSDGRFIDAYQYQNWDYSSDNKHYKPLYRAKRKGVANCFYGNYARLYSVGSAKTRWGASAGIGVVAYNEGKTGTPLSNNMCAKSDTTVTLGAARYLPEALRDLSGNNASPLGVNWGFFGSPCWFATYDSFIDGRLL